MRKRQIRFLVESALIAALYAGLTYFSNLFGLAYGPIQFRLSEAMTILPILTPAAIPGLTLGCFFSNILSFNPLDLVFGTLATLLAAVLTYMLRKRSKIWALMPPVLINALVIGLEITLFYTVPAGDSMGWTFGVSALTVGIGQVVVCYGLGLPLLIVLKKYHIFQQE